MTLVEGDELQRLWSLISELSSQLAANRELCTSLQQQADSLKGQALHTGTGYTLRRFNLDISKEKFESDLERINAQLVVENQTLAHENKQMNHLLREYEQTLEAVMTKFRSFSHATQSHTLSLTSHYESLLANNTHDAADASLQSSTALSNALAHLGRLVRVALRSVEGEEMTDDEEEGEEGGGGAIEDAFETEGYRIDDPSGTEPGSHATAELKQHQQQAQQPIAAASNGKTGKAGSRSKVAYGSAPNADPKWHGTGGYTGLAGDPEAEISERALERHTEEERLRFENEALREMLRVSADLTPETAKRFGIEMPPPPPPPGAMSLSLGKPRSQLKRSPSSSGGQQQQQATETGGSTGSSSPGGDTRSPLAPFAPTHMTSGAGGPPQLQEGSTMTGTLASPELLERSSPPTLRAQHQSQNNQRRALEEEATEALPPSMIDEGPPPSSYHAQAMNSSAIEDDDEGIEEEATATAPVPFAIEERDTLAGETQLLSEQSSEGLKASLKSEEARLEQVKGILNNEEGSVDESSSEPVVLNDLLRDGEKREEEEEEKETATGPAVSEKAEKGGSEEEGGSVHRERLLQETEEELEKVPTPSSTHDQVDGVGDDTVGDDTIGDDTIQAGGVESSEPVAHHTTEEPAAAGEAHMNKATS